MRKHRCTASQFANKNDVRFKWYIKEGELYIIGHCLYLGLNE
jgi:hypothetical protein